MLRRHLLAFTVLSFAASHAVAADSSPLAVSSDIYTLIAETTMIMIDVDPAKHAAKAHDVLTRLESTVPPAIATFAGNDVVQAADLMSDWEDLRSAYAGEPFAAAFRESSYDTNLSAHYSSGAGALLMALDPTATAESEKSLAQAVRLRVLKTIISYLQSSTGIVGGTSQSANAKDSDVPTGTAAVDKGLAQLKKEYAGKPQAAALHAVSARWSFLRPALLKSSNQSTPFIVYTHGLGVAQALNDLEQPAASH